MKEILRGSKSAKEAGQGATFKTLGFKEISNIYFLIPNKN